MPVRQGTGATPRQRGLWLREDVEAVDSRLRAWRKRAVVCLRREPGRGPSTVPMVVRKAAGPRAFWTRGAAGRHPVGGLAVLRCSCQHERVMWNDWRAILEHVRGTCQPGGLDLVHPFSLAWLDEGLLDPEGFGADALGLLVANSRALWPVLRQRASRSEHPVDDHCTELLRQAVDGIDARLRIRLTHRAVDGRHLPVQRIAHAAGFAHLSPSYLSLHPEHGPWIAFRAVIVCDVPGPPPPAQQAPDPCSPCAKPCLPALERAAALPGPGSWRAWLAVRDACPQGRASRYSDAQIEYHYTRRRDRRIK